MSHKQPQRIIKHSHSFLRRSTQKGSALVIAIFIIIVLSALGAALVNMLDSSQEGVAYEVLGTRAYTAAQSGLQWQLSEAFPLGSVVPGLKQCTVSVTCSDFELDNVRYYSISSTGQCTIDGEKTSRTVAVEARSL